MIESLEILLPYQKAWVGDDAEVKVAEKSRRVGLTWAEAAASVLDAAATDGMDVYYISYNFEFTKEFITTCGSWAKGLNEAAVAFGEEIIKDGEDEFRASKITFPSGHKIMGLPARATTIRGRQGKIIIDEAAFCDNLSELLKAALAMLMWGGKVCIISTHNGEDNLFNEIIKDVKSGKKPYSLHRITITDAISQGLYRRICLRKKGKWTKKGEEAWLQGLVAHYGEGAPEELFCIPTKGGAKYFSRALVENCMNDEIPVLRYQQTNEFTFMPESERNRQTDEWLEAELLPVLRDALPIGKYIGGDFARSGDLSTLVITQRISETYRKGLCNIELRNVPFDQQLRISRFILDSLESVWGFSTDARGNGQMMAEMLQQEYGTDLVNAVMITTSFYAEFMPALKSRFESHELEIPKSMDIIEDFRLVTMVKGTPRIPDARTNEGETRKLRHGDTVVAECMVEHAMKNDGGYQEYSYEPVRISNDMMMGGDEDVDTF